MPVVVDDLGRRLVVPTAMVAAIVLVTTLGYLILGQGQWSLRDCLYMTVITLTTVGYGEVLEGMGNVPGAREFTGFMIVAGIGSFLYFASTVTAVIVEGDLSRAVRRKRMFKRIQGLRDHVIVCGVGSTGRHVVEELLVAKRDVVAIDRDTERLESLVARHGDHVLHLVGDATEDEVLAQANLAHAGGLVAALANDKDNLYLVVSTRQVNPNLRVVARGSELRVLDKLRKAGADHVVSPNYIGGMRMVSELLRPHAVRFVDDMLRDHDQNVRIGEVALPTGCNLAGKSLAECALRKEHGVGVLAVRRPGGEYEYNPDGSLVLEDDMVLVVLGPVHKVNLLREWALSR